MLGGLLAWDHARGSGRLLGKARGCLCMTPMVNKVNRWARNSAAMDRRILANYAASNRLTWALVHRGFTYQLNAECTARIEAALIEPQAPRPLAAVVP